MSVKKKTVLATGKRKTSVARVVVSDGQGRIRINNVPINLITPFMAREKIIEAFMIAGDYRERVDIQIKTHGGGMLNNYGAHFIDQLLYLSGSKARRVNCCMRAITVTCCRGSRALFR